MKMQLEGRRILHLPGLRRAFRNHTQHLFAVQAGPCAAAWDQFLMRYPALRDKIEQGAVAADVVNLVMAHVPIVQVAREEMAMLQAQQAGYDGGIGAPAA